MRILIVDDAPTNCLVLEQYLKHFGTIDIAAHGRESLERVGAALAIDQPYSLICLDVMMPEMDGQTALHRIRQLESKHGYLPGKGSRILMTTALQDVTNVMQAYASLCDGYLVKPIRREQLYEQLRSFGFQPNTFPAASEKSPTANGGN